MTRHPPMIEPAPSARRRARWSVPLVALLVAAAGVAGTVAVLRADGGRHPVEVPPTTEAAVTTTAPEMPADWASLDPLAAPDCDPATGRIMVPSVYAPNCVALWPETEDNGGATHHGVTAEEIVVAVYVGQVVAPPQGPLDALRSAELTDDEVAENRAGVVSTHQDLFETYGRRVRVEVLEATGTNSDAASARADAVRAAEEIGAFAVIGGPTGTDAFVEELVARQVLCLCTANQPIEQYQRWSPYVWSGQMSPTQGQVLLAEYLDVRLAGDRARHAGDEELRSRRRSFALVWFETSDGAYRSGTELLRDELADRGIDLAVDLPYVYGTGDALPSDAEVIVSRLRAEGVTTVVFGGDPIMPIHLTRAATAQDYHPEWVMAGFTLLDVAGFARQYDQDQWERAFGLSLRLPPVDPDLVRTEDNLVSWHLGEHLSSYPEVYDWGRLFTGIHLAGPELSPESFRDGLFSFDPVSGHRTELGLSYGEDRWPWPDHLGADDVTEIWWDAEVIDPVASGEEVRGAYRYTDGARRFLPGELDEIEGALFDPDGTLMAFRDRPEEDRPPLYPRRSGRAG